MFTGLIEEIGTVRNIKKGNISSQITIRAHKVLKDIKQGDSICTNGACLTVVNHSTSEFTVDVMAETMRSTNLFELSEGMKVNLERALKVGDRIGGHIVSGHIDGTGTVLRMEKEENAVLITFTTTKEIMKYIINKGSVSIDGVSLTTSHVDNNSFKVSIIPHTSAKTTILNKKAGDKVNIENDITGKYIERFISLKEKNNNKEQSNKKIDMNFLNEHGF